MTGRIAIAGSVAAKPGNAGHAWQFLQYLLGFKRLGWDVLLVDALPAADRAGVRWVADVMDRHGLGGDWTLALGDGTHAGLPRRHALEHVASADLLINVMGFLTDAELLAAARRRVFLDTDPGFAQMWRELGQADVFAGHDVHVTIGERIGRPGCAIPTCGLRWVTTRQPVVLDAWPRAQDPPRRPFTSVGSWRGAYDAVEYGGVRYGLRAHEFRRYAELPARTGHAFELALAIHPADAADLALLRAGGWTLLAPERVASTTDGYRRFVAGSRAELMVAKGMYVQSASGWFSERSICYLASGRPVLAQDTGLGDLYELGAGVVAFSTPEEAAAGVESIARDPAGHGRAAHAFAQEHFDSDKVLTRLLERL